MKNCNNLNKKIIKITFRMSNKDIIRLNDYLILTGKNNRGDISNYIRELINKDIDNYYHIKEI